MSRRPVLVLILVCLLLFIAYRPMHTSSSQSSNHSLSLNGTSGYVSVPNSTSINVSGPITIEAWIKVTAITGNYQDIVCRESWAQAGTGGGYEFAITSTGKVRLDLYQSHNQYTTVIGATTITTGAWHHVAGVFDGSQMRVYLNGVLDGSISTTSGPASGTSPLNIGKSTYTTYYFGGLIDQVRISAAALYSSNFTAGLGPANQTRAFWKFNGQTTNDFSANVNNGILQCNATYSTDVPLDNNNSPTVSLTHPQSNTSFAAGSTVVLDATATDSDGIISKVEFYQSTTLIGADTSVPYTYSWNNVPNGTYSLTAKASDDSGAVTTSNAVTVNVLDSVTFHSLSLNGTSGHVTVPGSSSINISGPITIEAWIKVTAITGNYQDIVCRESWGQAGTGGGYEFAITSTGKVRLDLYQSHNHYTTVIGATTITTGAWHHVAGVFDGSQMRVYLNGVLDGSISTTSGPASGTSPLNIGKSTYTTYYFGGLIDEVRISAAALYNSNFAPGLGPANQTRAYWKFDGQTANDSSGNGNNGTLQTGATYATGVPAQGGLQQPVPVANGPYNGLTSEAIQFNSSGSADPDGSIVSYHWNFGDSTSANTANPSHTYAGGGSYTASLTVTDNSGLLVSTTSAVTIGSSSDARIDPLNGTGGGGENPLSQNFNWNVPLVNLPGRAGLDLNLALSYNSLVWTKAGNYILFDQDNGFPGPGFRLGFPVIQQLHYNSETGKQGYLLISPDGRRTELRRVANSMLFESADSSHVLLDTNEMTLRTADGMQLSYVAVGAQFQCTQIKDRNGNFITIEYVSGRLDKAIDTLGRQIRFNYDGAGLLTSITQTWNQGQPNQTTHRWAEFTYADTTIQTNFPNLTVYGPTNNTTIKTLSKVTLADDSHFDFSYTCWGQLWKIAYVAADNANHVLNYRAYNLPGSPLQASSAQTDCPRFTQRRDWAKYWNGDTDGTIAGNEEAVTTFSGPVNDTWTMPGDSQAVSGKRADVTLPDGTVNKTYFVDQTGTPRWSRGLPALVETSSGGAWQLRVKTNWTQDNTSVNYVLNPRVVETNVYDPSGNRARTEITYQQFLLGSNLSCWLPYHLLEYTANATTVLRTTRTNYNMLPEYTDRRILGLASEKLLYEGTANGTLVSKTAFFYDESGTIEGSDAPIQHDTSYTSNFVGRANMSSVKRYNVNNLTQFTTISSKYNTAGAVVSAKDASDHLVQISYADSFSDGNNSRGTLAYPTTFTDADGYSSSTKYNFDFAAITHTRTPQPNGTTNTPGPEQTFTFDSIGRLERVTNLVNSAYRRFVYVASQLKVEAYTTIQQGLGESVSFRITDGAGRTIAAANDHPGSTGGFSGQRIVYDLVGRGIKTSNPTETSANGTPYQWTTAGDDALAGWIYTEQTYDWKGRPLVTTNQDGSTKTIGYANCGCAGGQVMTLTDEGTIDGGVAKRRQQKVYSDVLGRTIKNEFLNWDGDGSVYATTAYTYNARDQVTVTRAYAGSDTSGSYQDTTTTYDGYGRIASQHVPEQDDSAATNWAYNADDTVLSVTDARGAATTYSYNGRHLVTGITYSASGAIPVPLPVTYGYDGAGNRSWMEENNHRRVTYHYDALSMMDWEERQFPGLTGAYRLSYEYNLTGQVKSVTDPTNSAINYAYDRAGRITSVTGTPYGTGGINGTAYIEISQYAANLKYRAWGALKSLTYGNQMTLAHQFNQRLQLSQFIVGDMTPPSGVPPDWETRLMSSNFQYYADGNLRGASDNLGDVFDRAYAYDQVGGAEEAYSGSEALDFLNGTNSATPTGPYRQSFQHDAFGNITSNTTRFWSQNSSSTFTYVKNRKQGTGINYDADGNLTQDPDLQYTYDAAGRNASIFSPAKNKTITPIYDGDGQVVHQNEVEGSTTIDNLFELRSTVMGGKVITELDSAGQKKKGYVYCNGQSIARQDPVSIVWQHENPFTGTRGGSNRDGAASVDVEHDPMGVDVGLYDPYPQPELWEPPENGVIGLLPGSGIPSGRCTFDGMPIFCRDAENLMHAGAADFAAPTVVWDNGWHFVDFNRETRQYEARVMTGYDYTSVRAEDESGSGKWHPVYGTVTVGSRTAELFRLFRFQQRGVKGFGPLKKDPRLQHPHEADGNLPFNNCAEFVDFLVKEAVAAFYDQPYDRHSKANLLGVHLMDLAFFGYDRHHNNKADGFKPELTVPGGQGPGVYGHILGQGGAKLGGLATNAIGGLADAYDTAQRLFGNEQAPAEMAGNLAGWAVGRHINNFLLGKTPSEPNRLRKSLTSELCK
jgi:YD repeat-containing protein